ncbi:MAG: cytochrome C [Chloroflexota bacterium]
MWRWPSSIALAVVVFGCGRGGAVREPAKEPAASAPELTPFELTNGIGPITREVTVGPLDHALAERGKTLFETKCSACHKMAERYVGPALGRVTERRSPAYIMNMILNPEGMYTRHPVAKQLLAEYLTQMPNLGVTQDEARAVLEYLREQAGKQGDDKTTTSRRPSLHEE